MPPQYDLNSFDRKVKDYIYTYPGKTVKAIQTDFDAKYIVTLSLKRLAKRGLITSINFKIYPVCSQVMT